NRDGYRGDCMSICSGRTHRSCTEPPHHGVKRQQICSEQHIRNQSPQQDSHSHQLARRNSGGDNDAEEDDSEWSKPRKLRRPKKPTQKKRKWQRDYHCGNASDQYECDLCSLAACSSSQIAPCSNAE